MKYRSPLAVIALVLAMMLGLGPARADFAAGISAFESKDYETAYDAWRSLADQGNIEAQFAVSMLLTRGLGVDEDPKRARRWLQKSAEGGLAEAEFQLGNALWDEASGDIELQRKALEWIAKAALQGHAYAQVRLGKAYASGEVTGLDRAVALRWFERARKQGAKDAVAEQIKLREVMTPDELRDAVKSLGSGEETQVASAAGGVFGQGGSTGFDFLGQPQTGGVDDDPRSNEARELDGIKLNDSSGGAENCPKIPEVPWWGNNEPGAIGAVVKNQHGGNWEEYIDKWKRYHSRMSAGYAKGAKARVGGRGVVLQGAQLGQYVQKISLRLAALTCLKAAFQRQELMTDKAK